MDIEERRARQREAQRRHRAKLKSLGIERVITDAERLKQREYAREKRATAKASGGVLPCDTWWLRNPEKHRERSRRWRAENIEHAREVTRRNQASRRSTPWGKINNCMWPLMHGGVKRNSSGPGKYNYYLGYLWSELHAHLESQFLPDMNWDNWGEVWEVDHIRPLASFRYESLDDPQFREAWKLSNLRPLYRDANAKKGCSISGV